MTRPGYRARPCPLRRSRRECSYSYQDWVGPFYPTGTKPGEMLAFYAKHLPAAEIDATYLSGAAGIDVCIDGAPDAGRLPVCGKLPGTATHLPLEADGSIHTDVALFRRNIEPLVRNEKFACALMQFPTSFRPSDATARHVRRLRDALEDIQLVAEFRHREWQTSLTLDLLRALDVGWVKVDQPQFRSLMRPSSNVTSSLAYIRFHGRNYEQWWRGTNETRYEYLYRADELEPWAPRVVELAADPPVREVLTFFNNHRRGSAARNAEDFEAMVASRIPSGTIHSAAGEQDGFDKAHLPLG